MKQITAQDVINGVGKGVFTLGVLANTFLPHPLSAQQAPRPTGQKLEPNKELSFLVIDIEAITLRAAGQSFPSKRTTFDLDGNPATRDDQVIHETSLTWLKANPQYIMTIGDEVIAILTAEQVRKKEISSSSMVKIRGEMAQSTRTN